MILPCLAQSSTSRRGVHFFCVQYFCVGLLAALALVFSCPGIACAFQKVDYQEAAKWILKNRHSADQVPASFAKLTKMSKAKSESVQKKLWASLQKEAKASKVGRVLPKASEAKKGKVKSSVLETGQKKMPFVWMNRNAPKKKRPMFIALHGGGRANVKTAHGAAFNTREWQTQAYLAMNRYPDGHMYFVPRMADDRDGRWYYHYCQDAYRMAIEDAVLRHNVDPNRIYLIGISEGAYTAYRLGAFMADRWAGAGSMAGGEPTNNAPPVNMRNLAFDADIGERDTMFDRVGLNVRYGKELEKLKKEDPSGYVHRISVQKGRGHGIDYRPCPAWLVKHKRNPWPSRIRWENINVHQRRKNLFYWLEIPKESLDRLNKQSPKARFLFDCQADKKSNTIQLTVSRKGKENKADDQLPVAIHLNDRILDLDKAVKIVRNGKVVFQGKVNRSAENLIRSLAQRKDPFYSFPVRILLQPKK